MTNSTIPEVPSKAARLASGEAVKLLATWRAECERAPGYIVSSAQGLAFNVKGLKFDEHALVRIGGAIEALAASETAAQATGEAHDAADRDCIVKRVRRLATLAGIPTALPEDDATVYGALFTCLGMIASKLERAADAPKAVAWEEVATLRVSAWPTGLEWAVDADEDMLSRLTAGNYRLRVSAPTASTSAGLTEAEPSEDTALLDWLASDGSMELDWGEPYRGDEEDEYVWRVYKRGGSRNDREWSFMGQGLTPREAIRAARSAALASSSTEGGETR